MTDEVPSPALAPAIAARLKRDEHGLFAAVAQQHDTGEVLMLAWMDDEALRRTLTSGRVTYWSRSRREYWTKGDTSGNVQILKSAALDCDGDVVLLKVDQTGGACHTGDRTCFAAGALPLGAEAEESSDGSYDAPQDANPSASPDTLPDSAAAARGPLGESAA
jgi:phosphoribosyl-AMP cyclohydrolase